MISTAVCECEGNEKISLDKEFRVLVREVSGKNDHVGTNRKDRQLVQLFIFRDNVDIY